MGTEVERAEGCAAGLDEAMIRQAQRNALMATPGDVGHVYVIVRKGGKLAWLPDEVAGDRQSARLSFDAQGRSGNASLR